MRLGSCDACLRRARLLELLAPYIEKVATGDRGSRSAEILARGDGDLARSVAGTKGNDLIERAIETPVKEIRRRIERAGLWSICRHDPRFPSGLLEVRDPPVFLSGRGDVSLLQELRPDRSVAIVGARRATSYGRNVARDLGAGVAGRLVVVSGMAAGVDASAHRGALDSGGLTVAVLGSGADRPYPAKERPLYAAIVERGLVLSEHLPGGEPFRWTFPARNRIMAGLTNMTVVVEAAARSGSLITSDLAQDLGRAVGAVPGPVNSAMSLGTNGLLHDGAAVIRGPADVLDAFLGPGAGELTTGMPLTAGQRATLARVEAGLRSADALAAADPEGAGRAAATLTTLELLGYLRLERSGLYARTLVEPPRP
jgi:DNA processing protein